MGESVKTEERNKGIIMAENSKEGVETLCWGWWVCTFHTLVTVMCFTVIIKKVNWKNCVEYIVGYISLNNSKKGQMSLANLRVVVKDFYCMVW